MTTRIKLGGQAVGGRTVRRGVALAATASLLLAACGGGGGTDATSGDGDGDANAAAADMSASDEEVTVQVWFGREDFQPDDQFAAFEEQYPNINVEADVIPLEDAPEEFLRNYESGNAPDIFQVKSEEFGLLSARDTLMDIQPILDTWQEEDPDLYGNLSEATWDLASWDGVRHGMALHYGPFWFTYRNDVLDELGLDKPTTWDEVLDVGRTVRDETDMYGYVMRGDRSNSPAWDIGVFNQMGGPYEDSVMQIDSEIGHYWLRFYQTIIREGIAHPETIAWDSGEFRAAFIGGDGAQGTIGMNIYPTMQETLTYGEEWLASAEPVAHPDFQEQSRYDALGWPYMVSAQTENPYEVGLVLQYLADYDQALSVALRYQPVSNFEVMSSDEYISNNPWAEELADAMNNVEPAPVHLNQSAMFEVIQDAVQWALQNPEATDEVPDKAAEFQAQLEELAAEAER